MIEKTEISNTGIPKHVGFIVDGNRRWARAHHVPSQKGHMRGYRQLLEVSEALFDQGVEIVSAYVFSTENWRRSSQEVNYLMDLALKMAIKDSERYINRGIEIKMLGRKDGLNPKLQKAISDVEEKSAGGTTGTIAFCFNYSGQVELVDAYKSMVRTGIEPDDVTLEVVSQHLYCPDVPDVDMLVRTSGEQRLSNFMLWRVAYSELFFLEKYWPDMTKDDAQVIIEEYGRRQRRFGA